MQFINRADAGSKLASTITNQDAVIAIPRGGIPIAEPICHKLKVPLLLSFPRKIASPLNKECAIGAINQFGDAVINEQLCKQLKIPNTYIDMQTTKETNEIKERIKKYPTPAFSIEDKKVVLVDDGIATGYTMLAAIEEIKHYNPSKITVAIPVCASDTLSKIQLICEVICLYDTQSFGAVGYYYKDFHQVETTEAQNILNKINDIYINPDQ